MVQKNRKAVRGFTLIELMIVVAIIGILAAIAIPKFADLIRKSKEGATKGNLGAVRSALSIYYGDLEGNYPTDDLTQMTVSGKFLPELPQAKTPNYHIDSNGVIAGASQAVVVTNVGGWAYVNNNTDQSWGNIWVNCTDTDSKGSVWTSY
jgi:prepilin-type N-terminal cleavage/methylation domain-containing protein